MADKIIVGCKLPHGIILHHPDNQAKTVELAGKNKALIIGSDHATTEVDADFWDQWISAHKDFAPVKSGAIFAAKNPASAASMAKEFKDRKTGFEPIKQNAHGVKPADKD